MRKALQHTKRHENQPTLLACLGIHQTDGTSSQIAAVFIGLTAAVLQAGLQFLKITGSDKALARHNQSLFVGDVGRDTADGSGVMGNDLPFVTIATGSRLQKFSILIGQLYSQAIQFEHQHHLLLTHEIQKNHTALSLIQRQQRDLMSGFLQSAYRRIAYCLGWRICHLDSRFLFQLFQLVKESVIDLI